MAPKQSISFLNEQERAALYPHAKANERTFYLSPFTQRGGIPEALRLQALYAGFEYAGDLDEHSDAIMKLRTDIAVTVNAGDTRRCPPKKKRILQKKKI